MNRTRLFPQLVAAGMLAFCGVAQAFRPPAQPAPLDFDQRGSVVAVGPLKAASGPLQAVADLRARLRTAVVEKREAGGGQVFVSCRDGFLTGPAGEGRAVPAARARQFAVQDSNRPLKAFLDEYSRLFGHDSKVLDAALVKREFVDAHNGLRTVVWEQQLDGLTVFEATLISHTTRQGELVNVCSRLLGDLAGAAAAGTPNRAATLAAPGVSAVQAITTAAGGLGVKLDASQLVSTAPSEGVGQRQRFSAPGLRGESEAALIWLPMNSADLRLCWDVTLTVPVRGEVFRVLVDAQTGQMLLRRCLTVYLTNASYRVYTSDSPSPLSPGHATPLTTQPPLTNRLLVTWSALDTNASPAGWINDGDNTTLGNNVDAHLDKNGDNIPDPGSRPTGSPFRVFDFPLNLAQDPVAYTNAAVVQLFYLNNWMHDKLYELGFTEAAGNFQTDNFGRGGLGNDAVRADAQDGGGFNNANFYTPADGSAPRMQMYLFDGPTPNRDGDLDAEVVLHEYTHGLSNRRVGGGVGISALQTSGMGEGWSDFYALSLLSATNDDPNACYPSGAYVCYQLYGLTQNYYFGIRRYPYSTSMTNNPLTFKDIDPVQASTHAGVPMNPIGGGDADEVHNMGEVWCVTLWEARANLIAKYGAAAGNQLMLQLVTDGMNLSPVNPTYLEERDAIIQADLVRSGGANRYQLWAAFAKRGMGLSATSPDSSTTAGLVEAFDIPVDILVLPALGVRFQGPAGGPFAPTNSMFTFSNQTPDTLSWQVSVDQPWVDLSTTSGVMSAGASDSVVVSPNSNAGLLPLGFYSAVLTVSDITHTSDVTRAVYLQVGNGYTLCSEPYLWTEPSSETALSFTGGVSATIIMPFDFSFYGQIYSNFHVTSHGLIGFGDPADLGSATPLPLGVMSPPYAILSPLWSDIDAAAIPGAVTWGVSGSNPDRQLIVRWSNARSSTEPTATNTFQVVLSEAASLLVDNEIVFQYRDVAQDAPLTGGGRAATIGLQDQIGQFRTEYSSAGSSLLADAMGMRFTMQPPADTNAPVPAVRFLTENGSTLTFEVRFNEIVAGTLTTNDFDLGGTLSSVTAVANVSGNGIYGLRYIVTASTAVGDYGSVSLAVRAGVLADLNGNLNLASAPCLHVRPFRAVAFRDDMELGSFNWTTSGSNIFSQIISDVWRWGIPSNGPPSACSPTHCWGTGMTGKCPDNAWATLQSPQIPVGDSPVLKYAVWYNFLNGSGFVEVFDGSAWINVTPGGVYNAVSGGWLAESVTLDSAQFGNRNLRVRFRVLTPTTTSGSQPGIFVDDVSLSSCQAPGIWVADFSPSTNIAPSTNPVVFTAYNSSTVTLAGVSAGLSSPDAGVTVTGRVAYGTITPGELVAGAAPVTVTLAAPGSFRAPVVTLFHSATSTVGAVGQQSLSFYVTNVTAALAATNTLWVKLSSDSAGVTDWRPLNYLIGNGSVASCLFQVLATGTNNLRDPPGPGGQAGGDDQLLYEQGGTADYGRFGVGGVEANKGRFLKGFGASLLSGSNVYVRAWDAPSADAAVVYGDSAPVAISSAAAQTNKYVAWSATNILNYTRDLNGDGIPDGWCVLSGMDPRATAAALPVAWVTNGLATQANGYPNRVAVWSNYVYVTQGADDAGPLGGQISIWSRDLATNLGVFGSSGSGTNQFKAPRGLAIHPTSNLLAVADTKNNRIVVLSISPTNGALTWKFSFGGSYLGGTNNILSKPQGVAIDLFGWYWVADTGNGLVRAFDQDGGYIRSFEGYLQPQAIAVDSDLFAYVADTGSNCIQILDIWFYVPVTNFTGAPGNPLSLPSDVQIGVGGRIYVADQYNNRVQVFSTDFSVIADFGTLGSGAGQLHLPRGLWPSTEDGKLYVADTMNNRVVRMQTMIDADGDGMDDVWEELHSVTDPNADPDSDGVTNLGEYRAGTDPHAIDTNGNGASDLVDMLNRRSPVGPFGPSPSGPHLVALTCNITGRPVVYGETVQLTATFNKAMASAPLPALGLNGGAALSATSMTNQTATNTFVLAYAVQASDAGVVNASITGAHDTTGLYSDPMPVTSNGIFAVTSEVVRVSSVAQAPCVVNFGAISTFVYQVQSAPLLPATNWDYVSTWTSAVNGVMGIPVPGPTTNEKIFYRVQREKPPW